MAKGLSKEEIIRTLTNICTPVAASLGLDVWGVELLGLGRPVARVFVDSPTGATIEECTSVSRLTALALDVELGDKAFPEAWVLEVSTPGLERTFFTLEQMWAYIGREISVTLLDPHPDFPDRKKFQGVLLAVEDESFRLALTNAPDPTANTCTIDWNGVRKAHLIHIFPDTSKPEKPGKRKETGEAGGRA